jgi:ABC-type bacteriocin/lantibiotic exporter with double-glycine peptidase domain
MSKLLVVLCLCAAVLQGQTGHWLDVPFVKQPADGCGAASIAMVMQYWEHNSGPSDVARIQRSLFSEEAHGIYASQMQRYFEENGFDAYVIRADVPLLAHHIAQGRPVIVGLRPVRASRRLHYVVVAGVDPAHNILFVNDPAQRKLLKFNTPTFEREWKATGNWALLAVPRSK